MRLRIVAHANSEQRAKAQYLYRLAAWDGYPAHTAAPLSYTVKYAARTSLSAARSAIAPS
jgi:hypothetical protein